MILVRRTIYIMSPSLPSTQAIASECTFTLSGARPHRVLRASGQVITCALTHPRYGEIARVIVWHFDRTFIRGRYLTTDLDGEAREDRDMYVLYTFVFDKFGKVWPWVGDVADEWNRGTGVWGRESDEGTLILIGDIEMGEPCKPMTRIISNSMTPAIR